MSEQNFAISSAIFADIAAFFMINYYNMISYQKLYYVVQIVIKILENLLVLLLAMQGFIMIDYMKILDLY